jgi:hypothetical protein
MKSILFTMLLIGFSCGANAARLEFDSHSSYHGQHGSSQDSHRGHDEDFDNVIEKFSKHSWHPHHLFSLLSNKGHGGWHEGPFCHNGGPGTDPIPDPSNVPVPAALWLFGSAILGLAGMKRKRT